MNEGVGKNLRCADTMSGLVGVGPLRGDAFWLFFFLEWVQLLAVGYLFFDEPSSDM